MKDKFTLLIMTFTLVLCFDGSAYAKKYKPINEIPGQVPETDEERRVWQVGLAHQKEVRGSEQLVNNQELEEYLEGIIIKLMGNMVEEIGLDVDVLVFKDPTVNAWVYPNGTVAVQTGLLAAMENEAQLAAIMGHEVAHFLNRHAFIQIKAKQKQSIIGKGIGVLATVGMAAETGQVNTGLLNSGQIWTDLVTSGYSRKLETAADSQGMQLMIAAGYPPEQALPAFEKMRIADDDVVNVSKMWSSHPDIDARKKNLAKRIKKNKEQTRNEGMDQQQYLKAVRLAALSNSQLQVDGRQFDQAIQQLKKLTDTLEGDATGYYLLGEAYRKQNNQTNLELSISAYHKAVATKPEFSEPWRELGLAYRRQGLSDKARDAFQRYLDLTPEAADAPIVAWYQKNLAVQQTAQ